MRYIVAFLAVFLAGCQTNTRRDIRSEQIVGAQTIQLEPGRKVSHVTPLLNTTADRVAVETRAAYEDEQPETVEVEFFNTRGVRYFRYIIQERPAANK